MRCSFSQSFPRILLYIPHSDLFEFEGDFSGIEDLGFQKQFAIIDVNYDS